MLKIDVEGFETEVISGAHSILQKQDLRCVLMELAGYGKRYGFDENALRQRMADLDFESCRYDPFTRCLHVKSLEESKNRRLKTHCLYETLNSYVGGLKARPLSPSEAGGFDG